MRGVTPRPHVQPTASLLFGAQVDTERVLKVSNFRQQRRGACAKAFMGYSKGKMQFSLLGLALMRTELGGMTRLYLQTVLWARILHIV